MMEKETVKQMETCNEEACSLLEDISFKDSKSEIEAIEIVSGLLFQMKEYIEFTSLAASSYKLTNDKVSGEQVYRMLQAKASEILNK